MLWPWIIGAIAAAGAIGHVENSGGSVSTEPSDPKPNQPVLLPPASWLDAIGVPLVLFTLTDGVLLVVMLLVWPRIDIYLEISSALVALCVALACYARHAQVHHVATYNDASRRLYEQRLEEWEALEVERHAAFLERQKEREEIWQIVCEMKDRGVWGDLLEYIEAEIQRRLRSLTESVAAGDPEHDKLLAQVTLHERRMRRAAQAMTEYFDAFADHVRLEKPYGLTDVINKARKRFTKDVDQWFRHFLSQVDQNGVYRLHECLDKWPQETRSVPCPTICLKLTREPTPEQRKITEQGHLIDYLRGERDAINQERQELLRRVAEFDNEKPDSLLDEFQRSLEEFAGPDADAAERAEVWVQQRVEQFAGLLPPDDANRRVKVTRFEKSVRERASIALEAWRKHREETIGGEA